MQETWFYNKIGKEIRSGDMTASECLIPTLLEVPPFSREAGEGDRGEEGGGGSLGNPDRKLGTAWLKL